MAARGSKNHAHKYHKIAMGAHSVLACALPDCTHYMPVGMESLALGKRAICWECEKPFYMDDEAIAMDKSICAICRNPGLKQLQEQFEKSDV